MQITSSKFQPVQRNHYANQADTPTSTEATHSEPTESFTFSDSDEGAVKVVLGTGVMMTGMMAGAVSGSDMAPVIMVGSMFGGLAIMLS